MKTVRIDEVIDLIYNDKRDGVERHARISLVSVEFENGPWLTIDAYNEDYEGEVD